MDSELRKALINCETDIDGALNRFSGDEELYLQCLDKFLLDQTMAELDSAIEARAWDEAFTAAHAIKGLAGNMGFIPLFHATAELVVAIRTGRLKEIGVSYHEVLDAYKTVITVIRKFRGLRV